MLCGAAAIVEGPAASAQAGQASPAASSMVLHAGANLVLVDVVVTDKGNPVHGLDRFRFHILENGKEQPITAFDEHLPPVVSPSAVTATLPELPPNTYSNLPLYPDAGVVNVLLLDALNTPMANQADARREMIAYLGHVKPGTSLAIFALASHLRLVEGFTTDAARLTKALQTRKGNPQQSVLLDSNGDFAHEAIENTLASMGDSSHMPSVDSVAALTQFETDLTAFQTEVRVRMTLDALQQLARYLSAIPGRKNLIWFSGSFPITLGPDQSQADPFQSMQNYSDDIRKASELLTSARVAVYPVDARGMLTQRTADANYVPSMNGFNVNSQGRLEVANRATNNSNVVKDLNTQMNQNMEQHDSMKVIAESTGGIAFVNTNDLKDAVTSAVENGASYYTIGFAPGGKKLDGYYRRLQLRLDNASYNLAYRRGYYADAEFKPSAHNAGTADLIQSATLHGAPVATQVLFKALVLPATDPLFEGVKFSDGPAGDMSATLKRPHRYIIGLEVDPRGVAFDATPDGMHVAQLEFVVIAYDAEGNRLNYLDHSYGFNLKPDRYALAMESGIHARLAIDLPAGNVFLRIAVQDLATGHAGSLEVPVAVAAN